MAHAKHRLVLLRPRPDTVRGFTLHKTLISTFLTARIPSITSVGKGFQPGYSGLPVQGAAASPPTRIIASIPYFEKKRNRFCMGARRFFFPLLRRLPYFSRNFAAFHAFCAFCLTFTAKTGYNNYRTPRRGNKRAAFTKTG